MHENQQTFDTSALAVTPAAVAKIQEILTEEGGSSNLRVFVQGGGCAGFSYGFTFDEEVNEDDFVYNHGGFNLIVDSMSLQYLQGSEITYKDDLMGSNFVISNPNAETTCGCGSSFSI